MSLLYSYSCPLIADPYVISYLQYVSFVLCCQVTNAHSFEYTAFSLVFRTSVIILFLCTQSLRIWSAHSRQSPDVQGQVFQWMSMISQIQSAAGSLNPHFGTSLIDRSPVRLTVLFQSDSQICETELENRIDLGCFR